MTSKEAQSSSLPIHGRLLLDSDTLQAACCCTKDVVDAHEPSVDDGQACPRSAYRHDDKHVPYGCLHCAGALECDVYQLCGSRMDQLRLPDPTN